MNRNTEGAVRLIIDRLEKRFGTYDFQTLFEYILTDRRSGIPGNRFYRDPAYQYLLLRPYAQWAERRSRAGTYHAPDDPAQKDKL